MSDDNNSLKHHIKELFDIVVQHDKNDQQSIIDNCHYSDEIKQKVSRLIKVNTDDVMITSTLIDSVQIGLDIKPITQGMIISDYVLNKQLGTGGQGEVWLAQRQKGDFNHQVAIKFLKPIHDKKELQRFQNERELLAQLKHNNIAQLLGGGELVSQSNNPRPYMVLEYVEGLPLIEYCKKHEFTLKQYLQCFLQICDAISYAHSHLVIHRDIKPSNIFINQDGVVKLLDFGIAKIVDKQEFNTQTVPIMTLAYSSPEQVTGAAISTATDIYTLGLVLYEMLTGQRAQSVSTDAPAELIHEITDKKPTSPSKVEILLTLNRGYSNKQLKGDLDNLIMMAVRKEPQRRYATVAAMARDVKNYLEGKPLLAAGDSQWYKTKKLITRNPAISALSFLTISFLIALPIVLYNSQLQIEKQRDLEIIARKIAQDKTILANRTTDFLFNILESASPLASKGQPVNLNDVLEAAERQLAHGLDNQPNLKANLLNKLASIQHHLGDNDKAITYYEQALKLYSSTNNTAEHLKVLGQLAIIHDFKGNIDSSNTYRDKAIEMSQQVTSSFELGWHQARMATLLYSEGKKAEIRQSTAKILLDLADHNIDDPELLGRLYNGLALANTNFDNDKALLYYSKALNYAESLNGKMHPKYQNRILNKAVTLIKLERYEEAETILLKARSDAKTLFTEMHPRYSRVIAELGFLYHDKGRFQEAEKIYKQSKQISERTAGKNSKPYLFSTNNLGYLYEDMGQYGLAEQYYRESLKIRQNIYADNDLSVINSKANLARLLTKRGQYKKAQIYLDQVIPAYILNNKPNLSNDIVQISINIGVKASPESCQKAIESINKLLPEVNKISVKSWRRMYYELWLGQMAFKCQDNDLAKTLLKATQNRSVNIYAMDSIGQIRIQSTTKNLLDKLNTQSN